MLISLDYDHTYTADKEFWQAFIHCARKHGHKVKVCTLRSKEKDWHEDFKELDFGFEVETIFTDGMPKKQFMEDLGHNVDIWIDDSPATITMGSVFTPEQLVKWREDNKKNGT